MIIMSPRELSNNVDTEEGKEEPTVVEVPKPYESSEKSEDDKLYDGHFSEDKNVINKEPTPNYDQVTPPIPQNSVTEELEKIFGKDVEEFEQMKNDTSTTWLTQRDLKNEDMLPVVEKGEQRSAHNNLIVDHPPEKLANLIGNNSISIGRTNEEIHRKPEFNSDYSSLRIERVKAKEREPEEKTEPHKSS